MGRACEQERVRPRSFWPCSTELVGWYCLLVHVIPRSGNGGEYDTNSDIKKLRTYICL